MGNIKMKKEKLDELVEDARMALERALFLLTGYEPDNPCKELGNDVATHISMARKQVKEEYKAKYPNLKVRGWE